MKLSIIQNLLLNNSLFKTSLVKILALTLLILFPISLFFLLTFNNFQDKRNLEKRFSIERIIADSIITNSKYGDLIYARARALELGKNLDLVDLGICDQNQDVFERPNEDRCKRRAQVNEEISTNSIILNTQKYDLEFRWKKEEQKIYEQISYSLLSSFIISILFLLPLQIYLLRFVLAKVQETTSSLVQDKLKVEDEEVISLNYIPLEFMELASFIQKKVNELKSATEDKALTNMARQVSHDIRSPLASLKMALGQLENIPKECQFIIKGSFERINDIANNLLNTNKNQLNSKKVKSSLSKEFLAPIIDSLVSEKRMEYLNNSKVIIELNLIHSYGLFSEINSADFKRVISNLLNNSIEAIPNKGEIIISVFPHEKDQIAIIIQDNGIGMSEIYLNQLGKVEMSYGKSNLNSGSGLGIFHAKKVIESFNGIMKIESTIDVGTKIKILLPRVKTPQWFSEKISIPNEYNIYVVGDDLNMHKFWEERTGKTCKFFNNGEDFSLEIKKNIEKKYLCLIDYELLGQPHSGLDLIDELGIGNQSILVTSHDNEIPIHERVVNLGVKIVPKMFASLILIEFCASTKSECYEYVYIDDEKLFLLSWELKAKKKGINLLTLNTTTEFMQFSEKISKEHTLIFIDHELGKNKMSGEDFAKILHKEGYQNLIIATGHEAERYSHLPWLIHSGKDCPF